MAWLGSLNGELLPERAVMSLLTISVGGPPAEGSAAAPPQYMVSDGNGTTVYYACQTTHSAGTQGLLGALGLGQPPSTTTTCVPAAVVSD